MFTPILSESSRGILTYASIGTKAAVKSDATENFT